MAKIPVILEAGRADGKLTTSDAIFDENKGMFQSEINDIQDTLNSDNTNKPLSAKQGKVLKELLNAKVIETGAVPIDSEPIEGNITHVVNSDGLAKEFNKCNTAIINTDRIKDGAVTTEKIATSAFDDTLSVSGKIAPADVVGGKLNELDGKVSEISNEETIEDADEIVYEDNKGNEVGKINEYGADFKNLKSNGAPVITDISKKADKSYVDAEVAKKQDVIEQILVEDDYIEEEEQVFSNETESEEYVRIGQYGIRAKAYFDMNGNPINTYELPEIKIQIPDKVFAIEGTEFYLFNDTIALSVDRGLQSPLNYITQWSCPKGIETSRGWRLTPSSDDVGMYTCRCTIYTLNMELLDDKTFTLVILPKSGLSKSKRVAFFGDSLGGGTFDAISYNFNDENRYTGIKPNLHGFSVGGYNWQDYAEDTVPAWRISAQGISTLTIGARYIDSTNGCFEIREVNGNSVLVKKWYEPGKYDYHDLQIPTGVLTKENVAWSGDNTISYIDGHREAMNPLYNSITGKLDFARYRIEKLGLSSSQKFDMVIFQLGINGNYDINIGNVVKNRITALYNACIEDNPNCLFVLAFEPQSCNTYDGIGANYGVSSKTWGFEYAKNEIKTRDLYVELFNDTQNYPNVRVIGSNLNIDRYYGYPFGERNISGRVEEVEKYHSNYVHPASSGYKQLGDAIFASIIGLFNI